MAVTKLANLIDPEVLAPMVNAKIESAMVATPFARIDNTLQGRPGSTITIPVYGYIGDAKEVAEGVEVTVDNLTSTTKEYTIKKIAKDTAITDEALLSGYGNPQGQASSQLGTSIASKIDADVIAEALKATLTYTASAIISYQSIVLAIDKLQEEVPQEKVMFVSPSQVTQLRLDPNFTSNDKYNNDVIMKGEIGMIAQTRIVPSRKIKAVAGVYSCPIIKLNPENMTDDDLAALTIFLKRDINLETERLTSTRSTKLASDKHYTVALTDASKVIVAKFLEVAAGETL